MDEQLIWNAEGVVLVRTPGCPWPYELRMEPGAQGACWLSLDEVEALREALEKALGAMR